jgi:hypothetical protein
MCDRLTLSLDVCKVLDEAEIVLHQRLELRPARLVRLQHLLAHGLKLWMIHDHISPHFEKQTDVGFQQLKRAAVGELWHKSAVQRELETVMLKCKRHTSCW